jgi:hypothetical protein
LKVSFFYSHLFFFRKELDFFNRSFFNKLFFSNYPSFWAAPALYSLGNAFFFEDYLKLKISTYSFFSLRKFKFFAPFGLISFLYRIFNLAYHHIYKSSYTLFEDSSDIDVKPEIIDFVKGIRDPDLWKRQMEIFKTWDIRLQDTFSLSSRDQKKTWKKVKPIFSSFFFKNIGFFRRKFFFSLVSNFHFKYSHFFSIFYKRLNYQIKKIKLSILLKISFFLSAPIKKINIKFILKYLKHHFYFFKKEAKLLYKFIFFRHFFKNSFISEKKNIIFKIFFFWRRFFFLGSFLFFGFKPEKRKVFSRFKVVIFRVLIKLLKN